MTGDTLSTMRGIAVPSARGDRLKRPTVFGADGPRSDAQGGPGRPRSTSNDPPIGTIAVLIRHRRMRLGRLITLDRTDSFTRHQAVQAHDALQWRGRRGELAGCELSELQTDAGGPN